MADYTEGIRANSTHILGGGHFNSCQPYQGHSGVRYYGDNLHPYPSLGEPGVPYDYRSPKPTIDHSRKLSQYRQSGQNCWRNEYDLSVSPDHEQRYYLLDQTNYPDSGYAVKMEPEVTNQEDSNSKGNLSMDDDNNSLDGKPLSERNGKHCKQDPKVCGVCGDKALGNNFNAITCESCKAFFRRNALRVKPFVCPFNDNCKVDPVTRRFCQKCRLKKCFDIGMKKEWIMTDEEKKMKKQKIEQNRLKRTSSESHPLLNGDVTAPKVLAIGDDVPGKECVVLQVAASPEAHTTLQGQQYEQSVKQIMMPQNNNLIQEYQSSPETPHRNHHSASASHTQPDLPIGGNCKQSCSESPTSHEEHSRIPSVIHSPLPSHSSPSEPPNSKTFDGHHYPQHHHLPHGQQQQNLGHYKGRNQTSETPGAIWCENSDNSNPSATVIFSPTGAKSAVHHSYYQSKSDSSHLSNPSPVHAISKEVISSPNPSTHNGSKATVGQMASGQPSQMPLLASLMRRGGAESPPDNQLQESSASSFPESPEDGTENMSMMNSDREMSHYPSVYSPESGFHSPPQIPNLTGGACNTEVVRQYDDEDVSSHSMNHSSSRDSLGEELAPLPLNTMDSILSVAINAEFNAFGVLGLHSKELNKPEKAKLNELFFASQALNEPVDADGPIKIETSDPSLINVINLTDVAIRRLIKMSKKIGCFKNMCQEDQIALLKGGCTEMMILRSVVSYDPERDSWNIPHSNGYNIKLDVLKAARGNLYEEHQRFVKSFKPDWRSDDNIMIILCAITLFTAERPNVIHRDVVKLEQESYYYLLRRYLESTRNGCEARSTYLQLIQKIAELHVLNSNHLRVFLEVNPRDVEPLLIEIFDLKQ